MLPGYTMNKLNAMDAKHDAFQGELDLIIDQKTGDAKAVMSKIVNLKKEICELTKKSMQQVSDAEDEAGVGDEKD